jgi:hypothetical protein
LLPSPADIERFKQQAQTIREEIKRIEDASNPPEQFGPSREQLESGRRAQVERDQREQASSAARKKIIDEEDAKRRQSEQAKNIAFQRELDNSRKSIEAFRNNIREREALSRTVQNQSLIQDLSIGELQEFIRDQRTIQERIFDIRRQNAENITEVERLEEIKLQGLRTTLITEAEKALTEIKFREIERVAQKTLETENQLNDIIK